MESDAHLKKKKKKIDQIITKLQRLKSSAMKESLLPPKSPSSPGKVAPEGCLSVYVGAEQQRFVIKTEFVNHPLFRMLLEDAELEYGFHSHGPLLLPCDVDLFGRILTEIDGCKEFDHGYGCGSCSPFNRVV